MNIVGSSGWIEYFFEGPNAAFFADAIEETDTLLVPVICLYEVFKKVIQTVDAARAVKAVGQMKQGRVVEVSDRIALSAAPISIKHRLPMADSLIYATARSCEATVWTQDDHFKELPGVNYREPKSRTSFTRPTST